LLVVAVLLGGLAVARGGQVSLPASAAFGEWLEQERSSGRTAFSDPQRMATGLKLGEGRAKERRGLVGRDTEEFVRRAMPERERGQLPAQLQVWIEQRIRGRGFFGVYCGGLPQESVAETGHRSSRGSYGHEVRLNGKGYRAFVFGKWRDQRTVLE